MTYRKSSTTHLMHFAYVKSVGFDRVLVTSCERVCGHNYARAYARYSRAPAPGGSNGGEAG